jgi:hypothetical protein
MSEQKVYSPRFEAEVMARFDALDSRAARVVLGVEREAEAFALFRTEVCEFSVEVAEVKKLVMRIDERLTAILKTPTVSGA